jgi:TDG/mug DNA glycosylase family protein
VRPQRSLDSGIENASIVPNDFAAFFSSHPKIARVYFNGAKAEKYYRKHVLRPIAYERLPSTSPVNASMSYDRKLAAWRATVR